uniref:(northern house mosquito) hypothetical protein n=1 Tax=Culex pipiens TaxID=7175 RepID=A0A8D8AM72_CULPI
MPTRPAFATPATGSIWTGSMRKLWCGTTGASASRRRGRTSWPRESVGGLLRARRVRVCTVQHRSGQEAWLSGEVDAEVAGQGVELQAADCRWPFEGHGSKSTDGHQCGHQPEDSLPGQGNKG